MAKFRFYQDTEVRAYVRDYYNVEADTLDEAVEYVKNMGCSFEEDECRKHTQSEFVVRDLDWTFDQIANESVGQFPTTYTIYSEDTGEEVVWQG